MGIGIEDIEQFCLACGQLCKNRRSLGNHITRSHKNIKDQKNYVLKYFLNEKIPLCMCGCGEQVLWHKLQYRFNDYMTGHNARVEVTGCFAKGFKTSPEQIEKRNNSIRQTYKNNKQILSAKIGNAVSKAFKDPIKNRHLCEGQSKGWKEDTKRKADLTRRNLEMLEAGLIGPHAPFKAEWILNPFTGEEEFMHSSWETSFLRSCISKGYYVTKKHGITIPYTHPDGSIKTYVPDFFSPVDRTLYEVKGRADSVDDAKWEAAQLFCQRHGWCFVVMSEPEQP